RILGEKAVYAVFQPIVSIADGVVVGYEALARGPKNSPLEYPEQLFSAAKEQNKVWELELLCRTRALEKAKAMPAGQKLFINVDPAIINDERFQKGLTKDILAFYQVEATDVIFEITEKTAINDYKNFRQILDNYISQGYEIAIDDTGSGYSGLQMLAEVKPRFIKIDMELVRDIDKNPVKQALMKAFYDFSVITGMRVIAEGVETVNELNTLIQIGIPYGQGYYFQRPAEGFWGIAPSVREHIKSKNEQKKCESFHTPLTMPIGDIAKPAEAFSASMWGAQASEYFKRNPYIMGLAITQNDEPVGLLMKDTFLTYLATQYGLAVYMNRPVSLLMNRNPLIVDYYTPLEQVSKLAVAREEAHLYDYIIVTKEKKFYGITTVRCLLEKTTQLEINRAKHSNPLSGLPGNMLIEEKLQEIIHEDAEYAVLYFDLDNFKAYNDVYGFENGDKVLCLTAQVIQKRITELAKSEIFVGHIGGDDFIAIVKQNEVVNLCKAIIHDFDARIHDFYTHEDYQRGYIITKNRHGIEEKFPIVSLSIAVVKSMSHNFKSIAELAEKAGTVKKQCKLTWHSCYCIA
ncbi:MAG: GGDEF domain-containing protein, partial [Pelosinus sp.]|nr:GGDEF domain-containing protein [Pelosinus sp.]